jgi:hypothetical protein
MFQRNGSWDDPVTLFPMSAVHGGRLWRITGERWRLFQVAAGNIRPLVGHRMPSLARSAKGAHSNTANLQPDQGSSGPPPCVLILDGVVGGVVDDVVGHMGRLLGDAHDLVTVDRHLARGRWSGLAACSASRLEDPR